MWKRWKGAFLGLSSVVDSLGNRPRRVGRIVVSTGLRPPYWYGGVEPRPALPLVDASVAWRGRRTRWVVPGVGVARLRPARRRPASSRRRGLLRRGWLRRCADR